MNELITATVALVGFAICVIIKIVFDSFSDYSRAIERLEKEVREKKKEIFSLNNELEIKSKDLDKSEKTLVCNSEEYKEKLFSLETSYENEIEEIQQRTEEKIIKIQTANNDIISDLLSELKETIDSNQYLAKKLYFIDNQIETDCQKLIESNVTSIPWLAGMMGDFLTIEIEAAAKALDWGRNVERAKKVASLRELRAAASQITAAGKEAIYQLEYIKQLFPNIEDYFETDYNEIFIEKSIENFDPVRHYLSKDEWDRLSTVEKNQLALDRYVSSRKTKWQIGRDYELSVAYEYTKKGWDVDTFGSYMQLEDHGRDLIAKKDGNILIVQCKYWSQSKVIHEKHIYQLYGSVLSYCMENNVGIDKVAGVFVTNIKLTPFAERAARFLDVIVIQDHPFEEFPRIKCNVGRDEYGYKTHIYHLPMDAQYDKVKICNKGEFYAFTVAEAERAGFRRTYKWRGQ